MTTYTDHQQRLLDQQSGAELDKRAARARLIAAAPELLAIGVEFLPILERQLESINPGGAAEASAAFQYAKARVDRLRAAIAKARGE